MGRESMVTIINVLRDVRENIINRRWEGSRVLRVYVQKEKSHLEVQKAPGGVDLLDAAVGGGKLLDVAKGR